MRIKTAVISLLIIFGLASFSFALADEVLVIVNSKGPLVNISDKDIRGIYQGEKRFEAGVKIIPVELKDIKDQFLTSFMNTTSKDYRVLWTKKVFQDGIQPPASMTSADEVVEIVRQENGAIGYINKKDLKAESGIRIIKTIK